MFIIEDSILKRYVPSVKGEKTVVIPEGVRVIGGNILESDREVWEKYSDIDPFFYQAFRGNQDIEDVFIPDSVVEIGGKSFLNCSNIKRVRIPRGVSHILEFWDNRLEAVTFGGTRAEFARLAQPGWCRSCEVVHCTDGDIPGGYL